MNMDSTAKKLTEFADALDRASALAREIAESAEHRAEIKLDEEKIGRVCLSARHDNPEAY